MLAQMTLLSTFTTFLSSFILLVILSASFRDQSMMIKKCLPEPNPESLQVCYWKRVEKKL